MKLSPTFISCIYKLGILLFREMYTFRRIFLGKTLRNSQKTQSIIITIKEFLHFGSNMIYKLEESQNQIFANQITVKNSSQQILLKDRLILMFQNLQKIYQCFKSMNQCLIFQFCLQNMDNIPEKKLKIYNVRQMSLPVSGNKALMMTFDVLSIVDIITAQVTLKIKRDYYPKFAQISPNGKCIIVVYSTTQIVIFDTQTGKQLSKLSHFPTQPQLPKAFIFSGNSKKVVAATSTILYLWNVVESRVQMRANNWKNINTFAINYQGNIFALGTFNGVIFYITKADEGLCKQLQLKRHTSCIICLCFHDKTLVSASFDGMILISNIIQNQSTGQKSIRYGQHKVQEIPREIKSCGNKYYFINAKAMYWLSDSGKFVGFTDNKSYNITQSSQKELYYIKYDNGFLQWWPQKNVINQYDKKSNENQKIRTVKYVIRK